MIEYKMTPFEIVHLRKKNYWRGFWIGCAVIAIPGVIAFVVFCNMIVKIQ